MTTPKPASRRPCRRAGAAGARHVLEKERIIDSNEKITREHIQKLRSLAAEKVAREGREGVFASCCPILADS